MADSARGRCSLGPGKGVSIDLTEAEFTLLTEYAAMQGVDPSVAAAELFGARLAEVAKAMTGQRCSAAVMQFQKARRGE